MTKKKTKLDSLKTTKGTTPKKRGRPKKSKLDDLDFADGKKEERIRKAEELEKLVGISDVNPYGTTIASVFEEKLKDMSLVDLQALAVKVGEFPSGTQTSLRNKLRKSFRDNQRGTGSFVSPSLEQEVAQDVDKNSEAYKRALRLMKEGL
jgi:hypothetical protein